MLHNKLIAVSSCIISRILALDRTDNQPLVIAIDGGSGSGKSSVAQIIAKQLSATLISTDDFYAAYITNDGWLKRSFRERAADVINWRSLRSYVLEPLVNGLAVSWNSFDFVGGVLSDGTYNMDSTVINYLPNKLIILEGAYSCRPELSDLFHLRILIDVPVQVRHERLQKREEKEFLIHWHERWDEVEDYYFREVCPHSSFHMVIENE